MQPETIFFIFHFFTGAVTYAAAGLDAAIIGDWPKGIFLSAVLGCVFCLAELILRLLGVDEDSFHCRYQHAATGHFGGTLVTVSSDFFLSTDCKTAGELMADGLLSLAYWLLSALSFGLPVILSTFLIPPANSCATDRCETDAGAEGARSSLWFPSITILVLMILFSTVVSAFPEHITPPLRAIVLFVAFAIFSQFTAAEKSRLSGTSMTDAFLKWLVWSAGFSVSYYFIQTGFMELSIPLFWYIASSIAIAADM